MKSDIWNDDIDVARGAIDIDDYLFENNIFTYTGDYSSDVPRFGDHDDDVNTPDIWYKRQRGRGSGYWCVRTKNGISSKSEALRYAISNFIETLERMENEDMQAYRIINISLVYPFKDVILDELSEIYTLFTQLSKQ